MDDRERVVIDWILKNEARLNLRVTRLLWVNNWPLSLNDFEVSMVLENETYIGRGTDKNENVAFLKACVEAIEQFICKKNKISTNGVALHLDLNTAKIVAANELLERDAFFCYYLTQTKFKEHKSEVFLEIQSMLLKNCIELKFYSLPTFKNESTILATAKGLNNSNLGVLIGLGHNQNQRTAERSSFMEAMRKIAAELDHKIGRSYKIKEIGDHISMCALKENRDIFDHFKERTLPRLQSVPTISYTQLETYNFPLFAVQAHCNKLQIPFWKNFSEESVNRKRLKHFLGRDFSTKELNTRIHPLG